MKKLFSLALTLVFCLSLFPTAALANVGSEFTVENGKLVRYDGLSGVVIVPDGVTTIPASSRVFHANTTVTEIVLSDSVTNIDEAAFYKCTSLEKVVLGKGITAIPQNTFSACSNLEEIYIPDGVTYIGDNAFTNCTRLKSIVIPDSVTEIGENAFIGCSALTDVTLGTGPTTLGAAFPLCTALTEITIPANIRYLSGTFRGCTNLERVNMADTTAYDQDAFFGCEKLPAELSDNSRYWDAEKIDQSSDFHVVNGVLVKYAGDSDVETLTIPDGIVAIGAMAFVGLKKLISVDVSGVLSIENEAFCGCTSLERLVDCQDDFLNSLLAASEQLYSAWAGADPQTAVFPQSERITALSNQICAGLTSDYEKAKAVYNWVAANLEYDFESYTLWQMGQAMTCPIFPEDVLDSRLTVCDGYSRLAQALLQAQGIPALRISGMGGGLDRGVDLQDNYTNHAWNLIYADGRWIRMDSTWASPRAGSASNDWFDISALSFDLDHIALTSHVDANSYDGDMTPDITNTDTAVAKNTAYASTQNALVNGQPVIFYAYALKDANGNLTNYVKLRDVAQVLNGTTAQFGVGWDGSISITTGTTYIANGSEMIQNFSGDQPYTENASVVKVNGVAANLEAITLTDSTGGYTYFKLRDLGAALGFNVSWVSGQGIIIDPNNPYSDAD